MTDTADSDEAAWHQLTVITFNAHHGVGRDGRLDLRRTAQVIVEANADIAFVQELDRNFSRRSAFADQPTELTRLINQMRAPSKKPMTARFQANVTKPGAGYGTAILSAFGFAAPVSTLALPNDFGFEQRGALSVAIPITSELMLRAVGTHLQCRFATTPAVDSLTTTTRLDQAGAIAQLIAGDNSPIIVAGDFNAPADSVELGPLRTNLVDAFQTSASQSRDIRTHSIDHVFVSKAIRVLEVSTPATDASDHWPVIATLAIAGNAMAR